MKSILTLALIFLTGACASTGYNPHYILSDTLDEEITLSEESVSDPTSF
jgi:hypothetical protein